MCDMLITVFGVLLSFLPLLGERWHRVAMTERGITTF